METAEETKQRYVEASRRHMAARRKVDLLQLPDGPLINGELHVLTREQLAAVREERDASEELIRASQARAKALGIFDDE